ncbi:TRAP transporter substrate-binding protein [Halococcus thailandensis]|nr:TRAP transporter substrate-binding protein DctP [Halococcus thailandensis]
MDRRTALKQIGLGVIGSAALAGCTQSSGQVPAQSLIGDGSQVSNNSLEFTYAGSTVKSGTCWNCVNPSIVWRLAERLNTNSNGRIQATYVGESQLCDQGSCHSKIRNDVIPVAGTSIGNSTKAYPENNVWVRPYTFPSRASMTYTLFNEAIWNEYWVPFAKKYNIIPFAASVPYFRQIFIGVDAPVPKNARIPSDIQGLEIRRTFSRVPSISIDEWGAVPVNLSWGDTLQGLRTGVVSGLETGSAALIAYGMAEATSQAIINNWGFGHSVLWARVDFLKELSEKNQRVVADTTRTLTEEATHLADEVANKRAGIASSPPEGSGFAKNDVQVNTLSENERQQWREPVDPMKNPTLYQKNQREVAALGAEGIYDRIWATARQSPESSSDITIDSWWDDHLDKI